MGDREWEVNATLNGRKISCQTYLRMLRYRRTSVCLSSYTCTIAPYKKRAKDCQLCSKEPWPAKLVVLWEGGKLYFWRRRRRIRFLWVIEPFPTFPPLPSRGSIRGFNKQFGFFQILVCVTALSLAFHFCFRPCVLLFLNDKDEYCM